MGHFIVAGAGIAGLATALALGRDGHRVEIFERRPSFEEIGAGLQLSPNATRVAAELGILPRLQDVAVMPRAVRIRKGGDGGTIAALDLRDATARYGAPFLLLHRADLHRVLRDAVVAAGIHVVFSAALTQLDPERGTARLLGQPDHTMLQAEGLIQADGVHSAPQGRWSGAAPRFSGLWAWRSLVPAAALPEVFRVPESNLWLGRDAHLVHYPLREGTLVNVVAILPDPERRPDLQGDIWAEAGEGGELRSALAGWHSSIRLLIDAAPGWRRWPLFDAPATSTWSIGRRTAVGDAAHPMLPFLAQGASQAFEDAAALARAVTASPADIPAAFRLYETGRTPRARRVQEASRRQGRIYHLGGPAARARDLAMALMGPKRLLARMGWLYGEVEPPEV